MPSRYIMPPLMEEAILAVELDCSVGLGEMDNLPERLIETILIYKDVKSVAIYGGELVY